MEILSTGEKIKRARIYKGYTLKDLCDKRISVSKMSCIENDKVMPDQWVLDLISSKLSVDIEYLREDIEKQLEKSIEYFKNNPGETEYEKKLVYCIECAEENRHYEIGIKLMHLLFKYYMSHNSRAKLQEVVGTYYNLNEKIDDQNIHTIYYLDMAAYLRFLGEYSQAANYYSSIKKHAKLIERRDIYTRSICNEVGCYIMLQDYQKAYEVGIKLIDMVDNLYSDVNKAECYHILAFLSLILNRGDFKELEEKAYELYDSDILKKATAKYDFAVAMFKTGMKEEAIKYINESIAMFPKENEKKLVDFLLLVSDELMRNNLLDLAQKICDDALNYAIGQDNIKLIERAYYLKGMVLEKQGNVFMAEMYLNLSLDSLMKFGSRKELYDRYMQMGSLYQKLENTSEAIKYFRLALILEKKL